MAVSIIKSRFLLRNLKISALIPRFVSNYSSDEIPEEVFKMREKDKPVNMANPFEKPKAQCILCKYNIEPDYKNVRLLSQFVSRHTGRIYGRHITGLCEIKQLWVEREIGKAQRAGMMATYLKDPIYLKDPKLYDPENPLRLYKY